MSLDRLPEQLHEVVAWLRMLVNRVEELKTGPDSKVYLTLEQASRYTSIPIGTLREWINAGLIAYKPGKLILIKWTELQSFIESRPVIRGPYSKPEKSLIKSKKQRRKRRKPDHIYPLIS